MLASIIIVFIFLLALVARLWHIHRVEHKLLLASQERFSAVFESSLPLLIVTKQGNIIAANQHARHLFGYDQSQLLAMKVEELMPARFRERHIAQRGEYMKHPVIRPMGTELNLSILTSTGKEVSVEIALTPLTVKNEFCMYDASILNSCAFDACVVDSCVLCAIYDISHQKKNEEAIRQSAERYRQLYELIDEGYCIIEMIFDKNQKPVDFLYVEINHAFEKHTGLKNARGKKVSELIPALEKKWLDAFGQVALTGEPISLENYAADLQRWFKVYAFLLEPVENKQVAIIFTNITEQKAHERRLADYGKYAQLLYQSFQIATESAGIKTAMKNCLDFMCEFIDLPIGHIYFPSTSKESSFEPSHIWYLKDPEKFQAFKTASEIIKFPEHEGLPGRIWKSEKPEWVHNVQQDDNFPRTTYCRDIGIQSAFGFPLFSDEKIIAIFEFFSYEEREYDKELLSTLETLGKQLSRIFEKKKTHLELEMYAKKLKSLNKKLDDFTYIVSHDLKEPLRGINTFSSFLLEDYVDKLDDEGKEKLNRLITLTQRMYSLIDQLLKYSKIGHGDLAIQYCDIGQVIDEKLELLGDFIQENHAEIKILKKMPTILCDQGYIGEVFQNLICNAIKYNDNAVKKIEISYEDNDAFTIFSVKDNGIGIPTESYDLVFKIFKRLHAKDKYGSGDGVGLAILKHIVEEHDGKVWIESTVGLGTTMYFSISKNLSNKKISELKEDSE